MPISAEILRRYPNKVFVETGTYQGDGVKAGLDADFKTIISFETDPVLYIRTFALFSKAETRKRVTVVNTDSGANLGIYIKRFAETITFWLDAHHDSAEPIHFHNPLLQELTQIMQHPVRSHTILIDNVRQMGTLSFCGISMEHVKAKIMEINPNYTIELIDSTEFEKDILVATC